MSKSRQQQDLIVRTLMLHPSPEVNSGGLTIRELEDETNVPYSSVARHVRTLQQSGLVEESGYRNDTDSGRPHIIFTLSGNTGSVAIDVPDTAYVTVTIGNRIVPFYSTVLDTASNRSADTAEGLAAGLTNSKPLIRAAMIPGYVRALSFVGGRVMHKQMESVGKIDITAQNVPHRFMEREALLKMARSYYQNKLVEIDSMLSNDVLMSPKGLASNAVAPWADITDGQEALLRDYLDKLHDLFDSHR